MLDLSSEFGKSRKNISSNLPFLNNSAGSLSIALAVAITNTADSFSDIHVSKLANTLWLVPPSLLASPPKPLSISSIQRIQGDIASALEIVSLVLASLEPTRLENSLPTSNLSSGIDQLLEIDFAVSDFPVPWAPTSKTPLGIGNP